MISNSVWLSLHDERKTINLIKRLSSNELWKFSEAIKIQFAPCHMWELVIVKLLFKWATSNFYIHEIFFRNVNKIIKAHRILKALLNFHFVRHWAWAIVINKQICRSFTENVNEAKLPASSASILKYIKHVSENAAQTEAQRDWHSRKLWENSWHNHHTNMKLSHEFKFICCK